MTSSDELAQKVLQAFAKIGAALREADWKRAAAHGLNPAQAQILAVLGERATPLKPSDIAAMIGVTRASASDSLAAVETKGLVRKRASTDDARSVNVELTAKGRRVVAELAVYPEGVTAALQALSETDKGSLLSLLSKAIAGLQRSRNIPVARMCVTCVHFRPNQHGDPLQPHHCALANIAFGNADLRLNCPEHEEER